MESFAKMQEVMSSVHDLKRAVEDTRDIHKAMDFEHKTYEGRLEEVLRQVTDLKFKGQNVKTDWHEFKYYKESEYRTLENDFHRLRYDFKLLAEGKGDEFLSNFDDV